MDLYTLGEKKCALYAVIPDNDNTFNFLVSLLYSQAFQALYYSADQIHHGALPRHVHFVLDEFAAMPLPGFTRELATMRSRNISASTIIQNMAQIKELYKDSWETIPGNSDTILYLGGNEASTHKYISEALGKATIDRHIYMDGMPKPSNEAIYYIVDTIQSSIQSNQQISFQYYEYLPTKEKVLKHQGYRYQFTPYALIWNRDHYYVVGWSEKHMKLSQFRVDRMTSVEMMDQPGHQLLGFEPAEYVQKVFGMYPDDLQMVTLFCENDVMRSIIDRFGEGVRTEVVDDDHFQAIVEVAPSPPFFGWIFTFAGKIRILKPDNVLEEMRQMASWL